MAQLLEMQALDERTQKFLARVKKESTRESYKAGLAVFQEFYKDKGSIDDFITEIAADQRLPLSDRKHVATLTLTDFINYMERQRKQPKNSQHKEVLDNKEAEANKPRKFSDMTINAYVGAVRALVSDAFGGEYKIPCRKIGLPSSKPVSKKTAWNLQSISEFIKPMKPMYKALAGCLFQSGQGINEILRLRYSDIQAEFEAPDKRPLMLTLKRKKTGVEYVAFLGDSALRLLSNYFEKEGKPKPEERIFPIERETAERYFSRCCRKMLQPKKGKRKEKGSVSFDTKPWNGSCPSRPHSLRSAFNKLLLKGKCPPAFVEYWMGHAVTKLQDAYLVSETDPEEWRDEYRKYEFLLDIKL